MHADDRTLVALCADLRACGAAMPAAGSVVATWGAEHCLRIDADRSGAALFCIASNGTSDEDTADRRLGGGNPRVNPTWCVFSAMRLIDFSISVCTSPSLQGRPCPFAIGCGWAQRLGRPITPCDPVWSDASTLRCTTAVRQSHRVRLPLIPTAWGCGTAAAAQRFSAHTHHRRMLLPTWTPVQHRCGGSLSSAHSHSTNASRVSGIWRTCVAQPRLETMGSPIHWKAATTISLPGDAVLDGMRRVHHHMLSTELLPGTLRAAAGWAYSSHGTPGTPWTVSDDRPLKRRTPLRDHASGSAALPLDSPDSRAPCGPHRAASGSLA
ncbi:hypothetical protein TcG_11817 [Trypanosoma cruzi]|nr:hypothetical protein TcG_11817 [Trypanosoma cruzi]